MSETVLEITDLTIAFDTAYPVVNGLSLNIEQGKIHGLIGESGSGKSLTALSVVRLLPSGCEIISGSIRLLSKNKKVDVIGLDHSELLSIRGGEVGFVFQDPMTSLNPSMRCGTQVVEILRRHSNMTTADAKKEVLRLFEKVRLPDPARIFKAYPHEISGGQRQRVMIAMAISCKPKLLIADEPTTALDVTVQKSIINLINELRISDQLAVLFISHDLNVIADIADKVTILYKGNVVESDDKQKIMMTPEHPYTKGLLACRPPEDKKLEWLPTVEEYLSGKITNRKARAKTGQQSEILLEVKDVDVFYELSRNLLGRTDNEMHALKRISFEVFKGESVGLLGESGSGKSTLGKTLLKLIEARCGTVIYRGQNILTLSEREFRKWRSKIQFVFQDPYASLNPKIPVGAAISEPMEVHGLISSRKERKAKTIRLLEMVGLKAEDFDKYPHEFSGGQRQRIVIARALSVNPECIICDEAVSALDVSVQAQILNLLLELKEEFGLTYLFITHDLGVTRFFCDRVLVMEQGEIVESGTVDKVFAQPSHAFTKQLLGR